MRKAYYGLMSLLLLGLFSCAKEKTSSMFEGRINVSVNADQSLQGEQSRSTANGEAPDVNEFSLSIVSEDGEFSTSWDRFADFEPVTVDVGTYAVTASYGNADAEGFDALSYWGNTTVTVQKNEVSDASILCTINKAKVSISYTEDFLSYFSSYSAYINTSKGGKVVYASDEVRGSYFVPGDLSVYLEVTRQGSSQKITLNPKNFTAEVKHEYRLTMDVDASTASLKIIFNDNPLSEENVEINISDEALSAAPPVFTSYGFSSGMAIEVNEFGSVSEKLEAYLNAPAGLARCELTTQSEALKAQGWPESVDLMNLTAEQSQKLAELGLVTRGLGANHDKIATIDFQNVIPNLYCVNGEDEEHLFTLTATDLYTKVSEDLVLKVLTHPVAFDIQLPESVPYGSSVITFPLNLDGDVTKVQFYYDENGNYQLFDSSNVVIQSEGDNHYTVTLTCPNSFTDTENGVKLKVTYGAMVIQSVISVDEPELVLSLKNGNADVWATKAYLQVVASAKSVTSRTISSETVEIQYKEGEEWKTWATQNYDTATGLFLLTGLGEAATAEAGVAYTLRAAYKIGGVCVSYSNELAIVTEAKPQVGNAGFEEWYSEKVWEKKGPWGGICNTAVYSYYPYGINASDKWWSTTNALTTQSLGDYSWHYAAYPGVIPTNGTDAHTASWHVKNYGNPSDYGVSTITDDNAYSGNTAMEVATVGWGKNNWTGQGAAQSGCKTRSAGSLFIGTYDVNTGMNLGHVFSSRPSGFRFVYKFYPYAAESAKATIIVYGQSGEIGRGEKIISQAAENFVTENNLVPVTYTNLAEPATRIAIVFLSSTAEAPQTLAIQGSVGTISGYSDSRHIGSILVVDDVELIYE